MRIRLARKILKSPWRYPTKVRAAHRRLGGKKMANQLWYMSKVTDPLNWDLSLGKQFAIHYFLEQEKDHAPLDER